MSSIFSIFTPYELDAALATGYVSRKEDPTGELRILNYTPAAAYDSVWTNVTLACRGLIYRAADNEVVARPFPKFFNYGEFSAEPIPPAWVPQPPRVTTKVDGSLGILYPAWDGYGIATRGSFTSEQALWATEFWRYNYSHVAVPDGVTPLFEIIYPKNRIVVNYGDKEGLVLLAVIDKDTGADMPVSEAAWWPGEVVREYDVTSAEDAIALGESDAFAAEEGVVLCWPKTHAPSVRLKVKHPEYVRLHRIVTGVSSKTIWKSLSEGRPLNDLLDNVPDEFNAWVQGQIAEFQTAFDTRVRGLNHKFLGVLTRHKLWYGWDSDDKQAKKEFSLLIKDDPDKGLLFSLWDAKQINAAVWASLRPAYSTPFATDPDLTDPEPGE